MHINIFDMLNAINKYKHLIIIGVQYYSMDDYLRQFGSDWQKWANKLARNVLKQSANDYFHYLDLTNGPKDQSS